MIVSTILVGMQHHPFADHPEALDGRQLALVRDPANPVDPHAVRVVADEPTGPTTAGYLPRQLAAVLAPFLDAGCAAGARSPGPVQRTEDGRPFRRVDVALPNWPDLRQALAMAAASPPCAPPPARRPPLPAARRPNAVWL